ncbi:hypothetical protein H7H37_10940, partial [Mycolicibacterium insubricum]
MTSTRPRSFHPWPATLAPVTSVPVLVVGAVPPWIGALDLLIVAGDDPGDPAAGRRHRDGVYRGARVVLDQKVRPDARETLEYFAEQDVTVKVISGDNAVSVGAVAGS